MSVTAFEPMLPPPDLLDSSSCCLAFSPAGGPVDLAARFLKRWVR